MSQELKQPNKIRVTYDELEWIHYSYGGYDFYHYKGKPFSGYAILDYHPNGNIMFEEEYKEGEHLGWDNEYYESGIIKYRRLIIGETTLETYEYDENGNELDHGLQVSKTYLEEMKKKFKLD
ncbi:MAG: hypothetical protein R2836_01675 [Chitinophagales bacterium]|nr:hypothetical protein [Chitinophagales bacterium]